MVIDVLRAAVTVAEVPQGSDTFVSAEMAVNITCSLFLVLSAAGQFAGAIMLCCYSS